MAGIFPDGGVTCDQTLNAECELSIKDGCNALFYSSRCLETIDPLQINAIISEIANLIKCAGIEYDCNSLTNLCNAVTAMKSSSTAVPTGLIMPWSGGEPPMGYLKCNGAEVSRIQFANLYAVIGLKYGAGNFIDTFNIPDMRGEFVRGLDEGRGLDPDFSRLSGSVQISDVTAFGTTSDVTQSHDHGLIGNLVSPNSQAAFAYTEATPNDIRRADSSRTDVATMTHNHIVTVNGSGGGKEVRPRNIAFPYIIKY